jgi:predicted solute-binding protein
MPPSKQPKVVTLRQFRKVLRQVLSDWLYRWPNLLLEQFPELRKHEGMLRALVQAYYDVLYYRLHYAL